ncbi:MAG: LuxR C-terminal-related transcriptional regulator [Sphingobium sp.]
MTDFTPLIAAIGERQFPDMLAAFLAGLCKAQHVSILTYGEERPVEIASASRDGSDLAQRFSRQYLDEEYWRHDPLLPTALAAASAEQPVLLRIAADSVPAGAHRRLLEEIGCREWLALVGGGPARMRLAIAIYRIGAPDPRTPNLFTSADMARLSAAAPTLITIAAKHAQMLVEQGDLSRALTSMEEIDACIRLSPEPLSRRERDVCARILFGMSTAGIALDLSISEQTVITHRKRAYQRLSIASQRELLLWYADRWNALHSLSQGLASDARRPRQDLPAVRRSKLSPAIRILMDLRQMSPAPAARDSAPAPVPPQGDGRTALNH